MCLLVISFECNGNLPLEYSQVMGFDSSPEPEPEFHDMKKWGETWQDLWQAHIYIFPTLFLINSIYSINSIVGKYVASDYSNLIKFHLKFKNMISIEESMLHILEQDQYSQM